jgi:dTDP-4-dehydrorhamnose reductase
VAWHAAIAGGRLIELWASPEPTFARIADATVRDQLAETGHDARIDDCDRLADLGVAATRYPVLWERVAPHDPRERDYTWAQARLARLRAREVEPIVTLLHHGSGPLYTNLLDPQFPALFADYAEATARAFPWVKRWTPINEALTTARFSTLYGVWYPNAADDRSFGRAIVNETLATIAAMERIRQVIPDAQLVVTEDLQRFTAADAGVTSYVEFLRERRWLSVELLQGRIVPGHPMHAYLAVQCDVSTRALRELAARATPPDLAAFNHYPHSERYIFTQDDDAPGDVPAVYVPGEPPLRAEPLLREACARLSLPLALGEVHINAPATERVRWLAQHYDDARALVAGDIDFRALGAWAAFGMIDWHSLLRVRTGVIEDGIYTFAAADAIPQPTLVADAIRQLAAGGRISCEGTRGWWERPERLRTPAELCALRDRGVPEGEHVRTVDTALA